jgi:hypothetical protein
MWDKETAYPGPETVMVTAAADRTADQWVEEEGWVGIVPAAVSSGEEYPLKVLGKHKVPCDDADAFTKGQPVMKDSNGLAQPLDGDGQEINAYVLKDKGGGAGTELEVYLVPQRGQLITDCGEAAYSGSDTDVEVPTKLTVCLSAWLTPVDPTAPGSTGIDVLYTDRVSTSNAITVTRHAAGTSDMKFSYGFVGY